jgi:hypothetical protein
MDSVILLDRHLQDLKLQGNKETVYDEITKEYTEKINDIDFKGAVFNIKKSDLKDYPDSFRGKKVFKIITKQQLSQGDIITFGSRILTIAEILDHKIDGIADTAWYIATQEVE